MAPSHYLTQCWDIVNLTLRNKLHWNLNKNSNIFIQENALKLSSVKRRPFCLGLNVLNECPSLQHLDKTLLVQHLLMHFTQQKLGGCNSKSIKWGANQTPSILTQGIYRFCVYIHGTHDDVIKCKHFPHNWPFVQGIRQSPVNSPHKGQWCGALMFSLICVWINRWVNNGEAGDLRCYRAHYDVSVMLKTKSCLDTNFVTKGSARVVVMTCDAPNDEEVPTWQLFGGFV